MLIPAIRTMDDWTCSFNVTRNTGLPCTRDSPGPSQPLRDFLSLPAGDAVHALDDPEPGWSSQSIPTVPGARWTVMGGLEMDQLSLWVAQHSASLATKTRIRGSYAMTSSLALPVNLHGGNADARLAATLDDADPTSAPKTTDDLLAWVKAKGWADPSWQLPEAVKGLKLNHLVLDYAFPTTGSAPSSDTLRAEAPIPDFPTASGQAVAPLISIQKARDAPLAFEIRFWRNNEFRVITLPNATDDQPLDPRPEWDTADIVGLVLGIFGIVGGVPAAIQIFRSIKQRYGVAIATRWVAVVNRLKLIARSNRVGQAPPPNPPIEAAALPSSSAVDAGAAAVDAMTDAQWAQLNAIVTEAEALDQAILAFESTLAGGAVARSAASGTPGSTATLNTLTGFVAEAATQKPATA